MAGARSGPRDGRRARRADGRRVGRRYDAEGRNGLATGTVGASRMPSERSDQPRSRYELQGRVHSGVPLERSYRPARRSDPAHRRARDRERSRSGASRRRGRGILPRAVPTGRRYLPQWHEAQRASGARPVHRAALRLLLWRAALAVRVRGRGSTCRCRAPGLLQPHPANARAGTTRVVPTIVSLIPSQSHIEPHRQATRMTAVGAKLGFDRLRQENREAWDDLWRGRVELVGAGRRWQTLADAAFYYMHSSAHTASLFSTSMFGLAYWPNYHYYRGQVMWDIETFVFPPILLTDPQAADSLLYYRNERLHAARRNAALNGYRGLQLPWASGPLHGEEMIRVSAPLITLEQHVGLSVAMAFAQYAHATGDEDFLRERAWPVLEGVAQWISSRVEQTERGYEIKRIIGIAEQREEPIDNAGYINMAAKRVLGEAAAAARRLGRRDAEWWERIAERLFIPWANGVLLNHDRFTPEEGGVTGATPEVLAGLFPLWYCTDPATERATIEFYLGRVGEFVGYPMLSALLGVYAAWIGDRERSLDLFEQGYADFILEPFTETDEFSRKKFPEKPRVGPFQANLGGFLSACVFGLPGIRVGPEDPAEWARRPVTLPSGWEAIEVERLWVRNRPASLRATHGADRADLRFSED